MTPDILTQTLNLSNRKVDKIYEISNNIVKNLPPKAIKHLLEGYDEDINKLLGEIFNQTQNVMNYPQILDSEKLEYLDQVESSMDYSLRKYSLNYFITTCLPNFRQNSRNLEWNNMIQLYGYTAFLCARGLGKSFDFAYAAPLWRLYSYDRPNFAQMESVDNKNRKETLLVTSTMTLAKNHVVKINEEIENNEIIRQKLNPKGLASLNSNSIETETGAILHTRGVDSSIRGLHTGSIFIDDILDESCLYSTEARAKILEVFRGTIIPVLEPYGLCVVSGTPMHTEDLFADIKKDPKFKVFEYPVIFPDGRLAAPDRFSMEKILEIKESLGSLVFSREFLVVPISDNSSIFPMDILMRATIGMENISFAPNIESYPFKMKRVVMGVDLAISGTVGADYSVLAVVGIDMQDNYHLIHLERMHGESHNTQVERIITLDRSYRCNSVIVENNGFQRIMAALVRERGLKHIKEFTTTGSNKNSLRSGWVSLSSIFERFQLKFPYMRGATQDLVKIIFGEFNSLAFNSEKGTLASASQHDDTVSAIFMAITDLRETSTKFKVDWV